MQSVIVAFYTSNINAQNFLVVAAIWLLVAGTGVASVLSRHIPKSSKKFWILVILLFPLIGLLAYLPFSLEDPKAVREKIVQMLRRRTLKKR